MKKTGLLKKIVVAGILTTILLPSNFSDAKESITSIQTIPEVETGYTYEYDKHGNLIRENYYVDGEIFSYETYEYDKRGKRTKEKLYSKEGKLEGHYEYEYNKKGKLLKDSFYRDGQLWNYVAYEYNKDGEMLSYSMHTVRSK